MSHTYQHGMEAPEAVTVATEAYMRDMDAVAQFIEDCCLISPHMFVEVGALFERWTRWAADEGAEPLSKRKFSEAVDKHGYPVHRGSGGRRVRRGLGLESKEGEEC